MKTPPADVAAGLETNEPDLLGRSLSSRNRLAAPHRAGAASLGDGERKNEHVATLKEELRAVKTMRRQAHTIRRGWPITDSADT